MASNKIPKGYQGVSAKNSEGGQTIIAVTKTVSIDSSRPRGRDFTPSERYHYHKENADKSYQAKNFAKATNHIQGMRFAKQELEARAEYRRKNPNYVNKSGK